jgi:hypothetical protein
VLKDVMPSLNEGERRSQFALMSRYFADNL